MLTTKDKYVLNRSPNGQHVVTFSRNGKIKLKGKKKK